MSNPTISYTVRTCAISGEPFRIAAEEAAYLEKRGFPLPTISPYERQRRRMSFRNQRHLYRRRCDATGKPIISMYPPEFPGSIVTQEYWWSDAWDPLEFGREIDFTRPFFEQFHELLLIVPQPCAMVTLSENCDYNAYCARSKDCFMSQSVAECENVYYTFGPTHSRDCLDCHNISDHCELCYEVLFGSNCYDVRLSKNVANCRESSFLFNCRNCSNCFFCSNLRNAEYCFWNEKLDPATYKAKVAEFLDLSADDKQKLTEQFIEFQKQQFVPAIWGMANENAVGNQIFNSKNVSYGFDVHNCEDVRYITRCYNTKSTHGANNVFIGEELYEVISVLNSTNAYFSLSLYEGIYDTEYTAFSCNSHDLFGCIGLRHKEYCILNKQYSKQEFTALRQRLINHMIDTGEWGEFFPSKISPFPINDSIAQDFCPLSKDEAERRGLQWRERDEEILGVRQSATSLAQRSSEVDETVCDHVYGCTRCGKGFKIQKKELQLIQNLRAPLPRECFECRYEKRKEQLDSIETYTRDCSKCSRSIETCFPPDDEHKVLCESCYLQAVNE